MRIETALNDYKQKNVKFPNAVLVYQGGVSDSQLKRCVVKEVIAFTQTFCEVGITPAVTVIVFQVTVLQNSSIVSSAVI